MKIRIKRVGDHALPLPAYESAGAAGMDLRASLRDVASSVWDRHPETDLLTRRVDLGICDHIYIPVGFAFEIPAGYEGQVRPRSGLAKKHSVVAWHPIGTVDSDYRGEVMAALHNRGERPFTIWEGERIAQLVIAPVVRAALEEVAELDSTERGVGGFGHTGSR